MNDDDMMRELSYDSIQTSFTSLLEHITMITARIISFKGQTYIKSLVNDLLIDISLNTTFHDNDS